MRLHGYCTECRRIRRVQVSGSGMARLAARQHAFGICADCENKATDERAKRFRARRET